uniref:Brf1 TBP-binding domain-containing protein n=1 Tax=Photinus pyralis TaxID=7054 RepID=A0A1Y1LY43_PHOPY
MGYNSTNFRLIYFIYFILDSKSSKECSDESRFIKESTLGVIGQLLNEELEDDPDNLESQKSKELGPDIASMGLANSLEDVTNAAPTNPTIEVNLTFDDIDDNELDAYIMSEDEMKHKNGLWLEENATYLELLKVKEEKIAKEKEEGKPEKKKRRTTRKKSIVKD